MFKDLIAQLPEVYQPITVNGETLAEGNRDCQKRWGIIKPQIKPHDVILEFGSATGYFTQRIAKEYPDSLIISVESDPIMCQIQAKTFEAEGIYNVVVCQHRLSPDDLVKWSRHTEEFDVVLSMAVLHHYPAELVSPVFEALKDLGKVIINEIPPLEETQAYGQDAIKQLHKMLPEGQWLGSTQSHLGHERDINLYLGNKKQENLDAFFGVSHPDRHRFTIEDGKLNGRHMIAGVNVWNLLHFNIVYPYPQWWVSQARSAYESITGFKSDVRPWNLLVTSTGLKAIDYQATDVPPFQESDLEYLTKVFTEMRPYEV